MKKQDYLNEIFKIIDSIPKDFSDWTFLKNSIITKITETKKNNRSCICCNGIDENSLKNTNLKPHSIRILRDQAIDCNKKLKYKLKTYSNFLCNDCLIKYNIKKRLKDQDVQREQELKEIQADRSKRKQQSIRLNVITKGIKGWASPYQRLDFAGDYMKNNPEKAKEIINLPYKDYLNHWYWWAVSQYVKHRNPTCSFCNNTENLNVHHKTYKNKGKEYLTWREDLVVLCKDHHRMVHNIK